MKTYFAVIVASLVIGASLMASPVQASGADSHSQILPPEIQDMINKILKDGCLDQKIVKVKSDGSTVNLDQKIGGGCDNQSAQTSIDQHIIKKSNDKSLDLKQTITMPKDGQTGQTCIDQYIDKKNKNGQKIVDQKICGQVLSEIIPTTTPPVSTPLPTTTPEITHPTELPSTGPGSVVTLTLGGLAATLIGRKYYTS